jgi:hypothetical protein
MITTRNEFNTRLAALIAETDLSAVGFAVKPHEAKDKETKEKTGEVIGMYATGVFRMPGTTAVTLDGETFYSKNVSFKVDAFKLSADANVETTTAKATAATVSATDLKARLAAIIGNKPQAAATIQ